MNKGRRDGQESSGEQQQNEMCDVGQTVTNSFKISF